MGDFLDRGDFFAAGRVLAAGLAAVGFAAVFAALAAAGTRVLAGLVDAVAATRGALGRGVGLAPSALGAVAADSVLRDFLVSTAMISPRFFDMCSIGRSFHLWVPWLRWRVDQFHISNVPNKWPYAKTPILRLVIRNRHHHEFWVAHGTQVCENLQPPSINMIDES